MYIRLHHIFNDENYITLTNDVERDIEELAQLQSTKLMILTLSIVYEKKEFYLKSIVILSKKELQVLLLRKLNEENIVISNKII